MNLLRFPSEGIISLLGGVMLFFCFIFKEIIMHEVQKLKMVVDLDERGIFKSHVQDEQDGTIIFELSNESDENGWPEEDGLSLISDGYMHHARDVVGLLFYMKLTGIAKQNAVLHVEG